MLRLSLFLLASCVVTSHPVTVRQTGAGTAVVNLGNNTGSPAHLASGILYGIPDNQDQMPNHFFTDIGFNYARAGGAQEPAPARGWIWGLDEYKNRFASALSNYQKTRKLKGHFIFLIHDLWGADGTQNSSAPYPGDGGDWTSWDDYLSHFISDITTYHADVGLSIDIWNEPDLPTFWNRTQHQYLQMWGRTYDRLRADLPGVLLIGPASAGEPRLSNKWWTTYAAFIAGNNSIPHQWVWHMESGDGNMMSAQAGLQDILAEYKLPSKPINIDEYATFREQVPAGSAWWISQLERVEAIGLRGNWLDGLELHDLMASLLSKPGAGTSLFNPSGSNYFPNGDWQLYKYYNLNMTGFRVGTLPSADQKLDAYATVGLDLVRTVVGVRDMGKDNDIPTGTWQVTINELSAVGLPTSGELKIHSWGFPINTNDGHFGEVDGPVDLGFAVHTYSGDSVTFPIHRTDVTTAFAFEFGVGTF